VARPAVSASVGLLFLLWLGMAAQARAGDAPPQPAPPRPEETVIRSPGHFAIAAVAQYAGSTLCTKTVRRLASGWSAQHPILTRAGCQLTTLAGILAVASYERHNLPGFGTEDWWADAAGAATGLVVLQW
jgi:hypothetical protein